MQDLCGDPGVFIRSMATRGALGGLARATSDVVKVLDAFGKDVILVETVGAGQDEVDIARAAHTTIVVEAPGMGDDIQAIKAGVLEIADILVVNKADREGAERTVAALEMMLDLNGHAGCGWQPPVLKTVATQDERRRRAGGRRQTPPPVPAGVRQPGPTARRERARRDCPDIVPGAPVRAPAGGCRRPARSTPWWTSIADRRLDPYTAAAASLSREAAMNTAPGHLAGGPGRPAGGPRGGAGDHRGRPRAALPPEPGHGPGDGGHRRPRGRHPGQHRPHGRARSASGCRRPRWTSWPPPATC